ncbi:MAG: ATPase [Planctomycetes bacterium]|nr:ATPase [Planctomycetota bacterium]
MAITNIKVSNFKSFKDLDLNLGRFNVIVGANASGKSNFVEIFRFLRALERDDLNDVVSLHGGAESILNKRLGSSEPLRMRATSDHQMSYGTLSYVQVYETTYGFSIEFGSPHDGAIVKDDRFTERMRIVLGDETTDMKVDILMSDGKRKVEIGPQDLVDRIKSTNDQWLSTPFHHMDEFSAIVERWTANALLIRMRFFGFAGLLDNPFGGVGVYDIEPHEVKRPHGKAGRASLERNGENLALVLRSILADPEKTRAFHNLLRYMLPFAVEIGVEDFLGLSLLLKLREEYYEDSLLANLLSDGTVAVAALITALFFEDKDVIIIEEPERSIHPHLISGLMRLMEDASRNKQIIITTHSPEVVRHAGVENLLLIARDKEGYSTISRPAEKEMVRVFLKNELGLDELFVQDALAI